MPRDKRWVVSSCSMLETISCSGAPGVGEDLRDFIRNYIIWFNQSCFFLLQPREQKKAKLGVFAANGEFRRTCFWSGNTRTELKDFSF